MGYTSIFSSDSSASGAIETARGYTSYIAMGEGATTVDYIGFIDRGLGNGATTNRYGFYVEELASGTVTNNYGLKIENLTQGGTLNYSIYTGSAKAYFGGDIDYVGTLTDVSDSRVKTNVQTIPSALSKVSQMRGVSYDRLDGKKESHVGLIAQELEAIAPELVKTGNDLEEVIINKGTEDEEVINNLKAINYSHIVAYLVEAVKELKLELSEVRNVN